jgi:hypothetical protein
VDPRSGMDDVEERKFFTRTPTNRSSPSMHRLRYSGSSITDTKVINNLCIMTTRHLKKGVQVISEASCISNILDSFWFLALFILFDSEDSGDIFLRNVG